jgi:hypothetical protein
MAMDWIHLAKDRDKQWAIDDTVTNLQVPLKARQGTSCLS